MIDNSFLAILALVAVVLGGIGTILGGISTVMHVIAKRTKNTVDDTIAADVDAAHAKLDELLGLLRVLPLPTAATSAITPAIATATSAAVTSPQIPSAKAAQAGSVRTLILVALAALGIVSATAMLTGCATLRPDAATAITAFFDCEEPTIAKAAADLEPLARAVVSKWIGGSNAAIDTKGLKADLAGIKDNAQQCAITAAADTIALAATSTPAPTGPAAPLQPRAFVATSSSATSSSASTGDQVRASFTSVRTDLGWAPHRLANGKVL